jgi:hypothetical protein
VGQALIDTGSSATAVDEDVLRTLGLHPTLVAAWFGLRAVDRDAAAVALHVLRRRAARILAARCRCGIAVAEDHVADAVFIMVYGIRRAPRLRIAATTTLAYLCGVARNEWRWSRWRRAREADAGDPVRRTSWSTDSRRRLRDDRAVKKRRSRMANMRKRLGEAGSRFGMVDGFSG